MLSTPFSCQTSFRIICEIESFIRPQKHRDKQTIKENILSVKQVVRNGSGGILPSSSHTRSSGEEVKERLVHIFATALNKRSRSVASRK